MAGQLERALADAQGWVGTVPGVVAVGEGRDDEQRPCIDVWVTAEARTADLPAAVDGVAVRVRDSGGEISAQ